MGLENSPYLGLQGTAQWAQPWVWRHESPGSIFMARVQLAELTLLKDTGTPSDWHEEPPVMCVHALTSLTWPSHCHMGQA